MAEEGERMKKSMEELEKEITCAICHEHYTEPKVLPCMHYYCKDCIHALALRKGIDKPFSCPECRTDITLPQGGIASLKPAFFINRMKEVHSKFSRAHGKVEAMCESCSGDKAVAFCRQCTEFICADCVRSHRRMKIFAGHKTVSLEELKEGGAKDILVEEAPLQMCPEHDEKLKIYCFDCNCLICRDCTVKDHSSHNHEFTKKAAPKMKKELDEQLVPLREVKESLLRAVGEIQITKSEVEVQVDTVTAHIQRLFEEVLLQILAQRKRQLIKEAVAKGAEKLERLAGQEKTFSISCAVAQSVIDYTEQCIEHSADNEVICMHAENLSRIEREIAEQKCNDLYIAEEADIGVEVSCVEDLKQLCHTKVQLIQLTLDQVIITGEGIKSAEVNKMSEFSIIGKLGDGKLTKRKLSVECHLKSLADGSTTKCEVDRTNNGNRIQYTPTVRGRHEIVVTTPGLEIAGSPFPVFVSIHPTQLVKPVRVITGGFDENPNHLAVNSAGEMVISGGDKVFLFNSKVTTIDLPDGVKPWGVAVDNDDVIYIIGRQKHGSSIMKLTPGLKLMKRTKFDAEFWNISFFADELLVCDDKYKCVMVFNKELEYVRKIDINSKVPGGLKNIRGVSSDNRGNLYVCGRNSLIHTFTSDGQFLRSFIGEKLGNSLSICVAGDYVYATDTHNDDIIAYTTEGERVISLKQHSNCDFKKPWSVFADKDGFIYVCDSKNKRVVVF